MKKQENKLTLLIVILLCVILIGGVIGVLAYATTVDASSPLYSVGQAINGLFGQKAEEDGQSTTEAADTTAAETEPATTEEATAEETAAETDATLWSTGTVKLPLDETGKIIGCVSDYDSILFTMGDVTFTAKEYFADPAAAVAAWYPLCKEGAYMDQSSERSILIAYSDKPQSERLSLGVSGVAIIYGSDTGYPSENTDLAPFSVNGIKIGSDESLIASTFGEPTILAPDEAGNHGYAYTFSGNSENSISFDTFDGKVSKIYIRIEM